MIWNRCFPALAFCALLVVWGAGCVPPPEGKNFTCVDDVIRVGDSLKFSLTTPGETAGTKDFDLLVGSDGTVNLYLLGTTKAAGIKFSDLEKSTQHDYVAKKYYNRVTVTVKPGDRFYTVAGEVKAPGRQVYIGQTTVLRAIAVCGDFNEFANRRKVEITRADGRRELMDCKKAIQDSKFDRPLCPGDHVNVPRSL
jgi:protein involved in polysaccharide export with SLBB domain